MEKLRKIEITPGGEVTGENFFNREKEFQMFKKRLGSIQHIIISQVRRTGKTSFLKEFINRNPNLPIIYVIIQGCQNEGDFYKEIYKQTIKHCKNEKALEYIKKKWNIITEIVPEIKGVKLGQVLEKMEQIVDKLENIFQKEEFILFIDEFPDFLINLKERENIQSFLGRFRDFRNECTKLNTILTGSINIYRTVTKLGLSDKLNEYRNFEFPLFSKNMSLLLFRCLLYSKDYILEKEVQKFILPYIEDGMPYFIQLLADEVIKINPKEKKIDINILKNVIRNFYKQDEFGLEEFHNRLKKYLKDENLEKPARIILSHLSTDAMTFDDLYPYVDDLISKEKLNELLNRLIDEAYVKKADDKYTFLSKLLAGWWKEKKHFDRR
ncbi:MAG: hypothetical protein KAW92_02970 [Candidatus Cloacimonetes bacterium]|nr:hypothetical protein [Candidatus Cloacimonadota bacterium]